MSKAHLQPFEAVIVSSNFLFSLLTTSVLIFSYFQTFLVNESFHFYKRSYNYRILLIVFVSLSQFLHQQLCFKLFFINRFISKSSSSTGLCIFDSIPNFVCFYIFFILKFIFFVSVLWI